MVIKPYTVQSYQQLYTIHKSSECHPKWIHYIEKEIVRPDVNCQNKQLSFNYPTEMQEIKQEIGKLHNHKNPEPDKIVKEFLKYDGPVLLDKIKELFNKISNLRLLPTNGEKLL